MTSFDQSPQDEVHSEGSLPKRHKLRHDGTIGRERVQVLGWLILALSPCPNPPPKSSVRDDSSWVTTEKLVLFANDAIRHSGWFDGRKQRASVLPIGIPTGGGIR